METKIDTNQYQNDHETKLKPILKFFGKKFGMGFGFGNQNSIKNLVN